MKHKKEQKVLDALELEKCFCEDQGVRHDVPSNQSEKRGNSKVLTRCSNCNITVVKRNFSRHRKQCNAS